jgi:hypothetical protein
MYCGGKYTYFVVLTFHIIDDVSAAVIDLGSYEFRAGKYPNSIYDNFPAKYRL